MMNGKVRCIKSSSEAFIVGNVYCVKNGGLYGEDGFTPSTLEQTIDYNDINELNAIESQYGNEFEEI